MTAPKVGERITVTFTKCQIGKCEAIVNAIRHGCAYVTYVSGPFDGLRGVVRLAGRTKGESE